MIFHTAPYDVCRIATMPSGRKAHGWRVNRRSYEVDLAAYRPRATTAIGGPSPAVQRKERDIENDG
jgi:hypothetical protein